LSGDGIGGSFHLRPTAAEWLKIRPKGSAARIALANCPLLRGLLL